MKQAKLFGEYKLETLWGTITTFYDERRKKWRLLKTSKYSAQNETFYNDRNEMREWDTEKKAIEWIESAHPISAKNR